MNQKVAIGAGIVVLLLLGVAGFLFMRKGSPASPASMPNEQMVQTQEPQTLQGTLKDIFASGKAQKCTFDNSSSDAAKITGTVYVSGGKVRGDFSTIAKDSSVVSHVVVDNGTSYLWSDASKTGMKFAMATQVATGSAAKTQGPDFNQNVSYSCESWNGDASMFALPTDITFSELSLPTNQCAMCAGLPVGASRDACKTQLNCP